MGIQELDLLWPGSRSIHGSRKQKKQPGGSEREDSQRRKWKEWREKSRRKSTETYKGHKGKRQRGSQEDRETQWPRRTQREKIRTQSPSHVLQRMHGNWRGFGNTHKTTAPGTARFLLNCPQGRIPPSFAQHLFLELNWLINWAKILPDTGPFFFSINLIKKLAKGRSEPDGRQ